MKRFKNIILSFITVLICMCSTIVFTGCADDDMCKLYIFAEQGGVVRVDNREDIVKFGDGGSKCFVYKENTKVKLKAIADEGYQFARWLYVDDIDEQNNINPNSDEIEFVIDDDKVIIRAQFVVDGTVRYDITYPTSTTGYNFAVQDGYSNRVIAGGDFKFKINLWQDYSDSTVVVKANNQVLTPNSNGVYWVVNVAENIQITVSGVVKNQNPAPEQFTITANDSKFTIIPISAAECKVNYGESFVFRIQPTSGWQMGNNVVVKANGVNLNNPVDGRYTVYSITNNVVITVEGIEEIVEAKTYYNISYSGAGFTIIPQDGAGFRVEEGTSFKFKVQISSGYVIVSTLKVMANGIVLTYQDDVYTIYSVRDNFTITVEGIDVAPEITHTIDVVGRGFVVKPQNDAGLTVNNGESFSFTIEVEEGYILYPNYVVKVNENPIWGNNGVYTIVNVNEDIEITVEGVAEETVPVTLNLTFKDSQLVSLAEDILFTVPAVLQCEIYKNQGIVSGEDVWDFTFNPDGSYATINVRAIYDNIRYFLEENSFLNKTEVSHLEIDGTLFIGNVDGTMIIDFNAIKSGTTVQIVLK